MIQTSGDILAQTLRFQIPSELFIRLRPSLQRLRAMGPTRQIRLPCLVILALLSPVTATAQNWNEPWADPYDRPPRVDVSGSAGFLVPTDWSDLVLLGSISSVSGVLEQVLVRDVRVEPATVYDGYATYWRGNYGFRVHGGFSSGSLVIGGTPPGDNERTSVDVETWLYDVRGAIGLIDYKPSRWVWPYAFVGFGGITYNLSRTVSPPLLTFIERTPSRRNERGDIVIAEETGSQFVLAVDELGLETVFAVNFGVGTDFRVPLGPVGLGLRVEVSDHVSPSPLGLSILQTGPAGAFTSQTDVRFGFVHHLRASAGLVVYLGR